ncbi:MAG: hypothetical protein KHY77_09880 [Butyricicoccus pullicaecorum]|nr:hypothetical protein [Butyricicoccus pullicaecorum]
MEIACDQAVIQGLDTEGRRQYGKCILNHAAGRLVHRQYTFTTQLIGGKRAMKIRLQELFTPPSRVWFVLVLENRLGFQSKCEILECGSRIKQSGAYRL